MATVYTPNSPAWANGPSGGTPLSAARLTHIENGIVAVDAARDELEITLTAAVVEEETGEAIELDFSAGGAVDLTLDNNCTLTFTGATEDVLASLLVIVRQDDTGNHTLTIPNVLWAGGSAPTITTAADSIDILRFFTIDGGTTIFGEVVGQDMSVPE